MRVETRIGVLSAADIIEVVAWKERSFIGIRHVGAVTGSGSFAISPVAGGTRFIWTEEFSLPWRWGGPIGAGLAKPVLRALWHGDLARLKRRVEVH